MKNAENLRPRDLPSPATAAENHARVLPVSLVFVVLAGTAACGGADGGTDVVRRDSAGVEIVENPGIERALEWSFERVATLGGEMEGPESFTSVNPAGIATDAVGNLYVLDADAFRVVVFDGTLEAVRTLGSEGEGPGELAGPLGLDVSPEGEVAVFDFRKGGLVRWSPDGEPLPLERPNVPFVSGFERTPRGLLFVSRGGLPGQRDPSLRRLVYLTEGDTVELATRQVQSSGSIHLESCGIGFTGMGPVLEAGLNWTYSDATDRIAVAADVSYVIDVYEGSDRIRSLRRAVDPRPVTEEMARRELGEGMQVSVGGGAPRTCEAEEVLEKRGVASHLQAVDALRFAPDGSLWAVRGHVDGEEPAIDVFDPDGAYVGTLPPGTPVPILFLPDGRLVAVETDDLEVDRLVVYEVDRSPGGQEG